METDNDVDVEVEVKMEPPESNEQEEEGHYSYHNGNFSTRGGEEAHAKRVRIKMWGTRQLSTEEEAQPHGDFVLIKERGNVAVKKGKRGRPKGSKSYHTQIPSSVERESSSRLRKRPLQRSFHTDDEGFPSQDIKIDIAINNSDNNETCPSPRSVKNQRIGDGSFQDPHRLVSPTSENMSIVVRKRGRGRPPKKKANTVIPKEEAVPDRHSHYSHSTPLASSGPEQLSSSSVRKRGRPKRIRDFVVKEEPNLQEVKRGPGRPRKKGVMPPLLSSIKKEDGVESGSPRRSSRKRNLSSPWSESFVSPSGIKFEQSWWSTDDEESTDAESVVVKPRRRRKPKYGQPGTLKNTNGNRSHGPKGGLPLTTALFKKRRGRPPKSRNLQIFSTGTTESKLQLPISSSSTHDSEEVGVGALDGRVMVLKVEKCDPDFDNNEVASCDEQITTYQKDGSWSNCLNWRDPEVDSRYEEMPQEPVKRKRGRPKKGKRGRPKKGEIRPKKTGFGFSLRKAPKADFPQRLPNPLARLTRASTDPDLIALNPQVKLEVCVDNIQSLINAERGGASRIELCSALSEGGLTPTVGLMKLAKNRVNIPIFAMIRTRCGDFVYSEEDMEIMEIDLKTLKSAGADGFVFGCLNDRGDVHKAHCRRLLKAASPLPCTFHRAFDLVVNPFSALGTIRHLGFKRILTSGQKPSAFQGIECIKKLEAAAKNRLIIMAGAGVNASNVGEILRATGIKEVHGSARIKVPSSMVTTFEESDSQVTMGSSGSDDSDHYETSSSLVEDIISNINKAVLSMNDLTSSEKKVSLEGNKDCEHEAQVVNLMTDTKSTSNNVPTQETENDELNKLEAANRVSTLLDSVAHSDSDVEAEDNRKDENCSLGVIDCTTSEKECIPTDSSQEMKNGSEEDITTNQFLNISTTAVCEEENTCSYNSTNFSPEDIESLNPSAATSQDTLSISHSNVTSNVPKENHFDSHNASLNSSTLEATDIQEAHVQVNLEANANQDNDNDTTSNLVQHEVAQSNDVESQDSFESSDDLLMTTDQVTFQAQQGQAIANNNGEDSLAIQNGTGVVHERQVYITGLEEIDILLNFGRE